MKKIYLFSICIISFLTISCSKTDSRVEAQDNEACLVTINPIGEITTSENPLSKAATNNIYLLQVYQNDTSYACGLFDDLSKMKVYLHKGNVYKLIVSVAYDVKNLLPISSNKLSYGTKTNNSCFDLEFKCSAIKDNSLIYHWNQYNNRTVRSNQIDISELYSSGVNPKVDLNTTIYNYLPHNLNSYGFYYYTSAGRDAVYYPEGGGWSKTASVYFIKCLLPDISKAFLFGEQNPTNVNDWFYGETTFIPSGDFQTLDMNFKRVGFKLKYELNGVTDGQVTVTFVKNSKILTQTTTTTSTYTSDAIFVPFYDIANVWKYPNNYTENIIVSVSWVRGIGITQDLGSKEIPIKRNCLNNVKIELGNNDQGASLNMSTEAESMDTETTDITVE
jgi:hypothetical protein